MKNWKKNSLLHVVSFTLVILLIIATFIINNWVEQSNKRDLEKSLKTALDSAQQGVRLLYQNHQAPTLVWANDDRVRDAIENLLKGSRSIKDLLAAPEQSLLRKLFNPYLHVSGLGGFFVIDEDGITLASMRDGNIGTPNLLKTHYSFLAVCRT